MKESSLKTSGIPRVKIPLAGPVMKASLGFVAGILLARNLALDSVFLCAVLLLVIVLAIITHRKEATGDLAALALMILCGMFSSSVQNEISREADVPENLVNRQVHLQGAVVGTPRVYTDASYLTLRCRFIAVGDSVYSLPGFLPCVFYGKTIPVPEGSQVIVTGKIRKRLKPLSRATASLFLRDDGGRRTFQLTCGRADPLPVILQQGSSFWEHSRRAVAHLAERYSFGGKRDLLRAMTIGDKSGLSPAVKADFAASGIAHLLAVSGLHVGILALALSFLLKRLRLPRGLRIGITLIFLVYYAGLCDFKPPVTRTAVMMTVLLIGTTVERLKNKENILFTALLVILIFDPRSLYGASLQLSFAAVWTLTWFYPTFDTVLRKRLKPRSTASVAGTSIGWITRNLLTIGIVSALAYAATAPISAYHFGSLPLLSIPVNMLAVPLAFPIVLLGAGSLLLIAFGPITAPFAAVSSAVTGLFLQMLSGIAAFTASLPFAEITPVTVPGSALFCLFVWLFILSRARGRIIFQKTLVYLPLSFLLVATWHPLVAYGHFGGTKGIISFLDVGQGDAALISYGRSRYFLIDTGTRYAGKSVITPGLKRSGIVRLDGIFLSHLDLDHAGGLVSVLEQVEVGSIFCRESVRDSLASCYDVSVIGLTAGDSLTFGDGGIAVLSPPSHPSIFPMNGITGENNESLLLRVDMCGTRVLFTGDIEYEVQALMTLWSDELTAQVLKVPHHGSQSFSRAFLAAVNPELAVISCGLRNQYGFPAPAVLEMLEQQGTSIARTDRDGSIVLALPTGEITSE